MSPHTNRNGMHDNSKRMFLRYALPLFGQRTRVLEIGPDGTPGTYQKLVENALGGPCAAWHTIDLAGRPGMTHAANDEYSFPLADDSYDLVLSGQVLEHVRKPWRWLPELARVCRPGGHVVTLSPVSWPYHEAPVDCWRAYPAGLRALCEEAGLEVQDCRWESLEPRSLLPRFPRPTIEHEPGLLFRVARFVGWPLARSFDAITIGKKPAPVAADRDAKRPLVGAS